MYCRCGRLFCAFSVICSLDISDYSDERLFWQVKSSKPFEIWWLNRSKPDVPIFSDYHSFSFHSVVENRTKRLSISTGHRKNTFNNIIKHDVISMTKNSVCFRQFSLFNKRSFINFNVNFIQFLKDSTLLFFVLITLLNSVNLYDDVYLYA